MKCEYATPERKQLGEQLKTIRNWRETKKKLTRRADELKARAGRVQRTNPSMASKLNKRSKALYDEAGRMAAESKHAISYDQVKRSTALGRLKLLQDDVKR